MIHNSKSEGEITNGKCDLFSVPRLESRNQESLWMATLQVYREPIMIADWTNQDTEGIQRLSGKLHCMQARSLNRVRTAAKSELAWMALSGSSDSGLVSLLPVLLPNLHFTEDFAIVSPAILKILSLIPALTDFF